MRFDFDQLVRDATHEHGARSTRAAGRLMSLLEDEPQRLPDMFRMVAEDGDGTKLPQPRLLLGVTGAPGAGKSTLVDALVAEYRRRYPDKRVGVVAVDPSSPFSGGAVLGDRVRLRRHANDPMVFVRSLATRGHLGGLTLGVKGVVRVMGLIGCDLVIIETVGVGQSEVGVTRVADHVLVVLAPGQGDSIQMLKAGLMEIADTFVINKADRDGAHTLYSQLLNTLQLNRLDEPCGGHHAVQLDGCATDVTPANGAEAAVQAEALAELGMQARRAAEVYLVSATNKDGIGELMDALTHAIDDQLPQWVSHRQQRVANDIREAVLQKARESIEATLGSNGASGETIKRVLRGEVTVAELADELVRRAAGRNEGK